MPKVTVITPAYNAEKYLRQTIESVLAQTFQDFEMLIIDDGSVDSTRLISESYSDKVTCIKKENGGVSSARNLGMSKANGDYIAFLDADDIWHPSKLEKQVNFLESNLDIGICYVGVECVDENLRTLSYIEANSYSDYCEALLLYSCVVSGSCSSVMIRRSFVEQIGGFDTNFTNYEDWEYWLRLSLETKFAPISEYLLKYRIKLGSASFNNTKTIEKNVLEALSKFFNNKNLPAKYLSLQNQSYSNNWLILSGEYLHKGKYVDSIRCSWNALKLYPQNIFRPLGLPLRLIRRLLK